MTDPEPTDKKSGDVIDSIEAESEQIDQQVQESKGKGGGKPPQGQDGNGGDGSTGKSPTDVTKAHTGWGANDQKTVDDKLDFATYVTVLREFLTEERTEPPLTVSIEGRWGTGKSSFMAMLRDELEAESEGREPGAPGDGSAASDDSGAVGAENSGEAAPDAEEPDRTGGDSSRYFTVEFNPWRHEQEDALWAAFMLEFFDQITSDLRVYERWLGHLRLTWYRLKWRNGRRDLLLRLGLVVPLVALTLLFPPIAEWLNVPLNEPSLQVGQVLSVLAIGVWTWQNVANPIETELQQYIADPDYENRVSFIKQFHEDFADILDAYVGDDDETRVFVFLDDLDRCLPQKAAELVQSINLMISSGDPRVFFVIGMDRQKVAAGIAAKHRELLEYLRASDRRYPSSTPEEETAASIEGSGGDAEDADEPIEVYGLKFADNYLEKFVQIPFLIPKPREEGIGNLIREMAATTDDVGADDLDGPLAVVELLLTVEHYKKDTSLDVDDLPPRIQDLYSTDNDVQRPLQVTSEEARAVAGEEEWWEVVNELAFTELDDQDESLELVDFGSAAEWFRERAGEEVIDKNPTLASAIGQTDDDEKGPVEESEILPTERIVRIGQAVAPALNYNPRNVKTFVNLFRLRTMLASKLGLFDDETLTPEQLAKFVAISLQWPQVSTKLREPDVIRALNEFAAGDREQPPDPIEDLNAQEQAKLSELLMWGVEDGDQKRREQYRLAEVPEKLFWISPRIDQPAHTPDEEASAAGAGRSHAT